MIQLARTVFTGGDYLWKTQDLAPDSSVEFDDHPVVDHDHFHRASVRFNPSCGRRWIMSGQNIVQKSNASDYRPQSTALLLPITESDPDLQRDVER